MYETCACLCHSHIVSCISISLRGVHVLGEALVNHVAKSITNFMHSLSLQISNIDSTGQEMLQTTFTA